MRKLINKILFIINLVLAAGLLISYLAAYINPARFFFPALVGLGYTILLLLNLIFILYWLIQLKKEIILSVIVILIGWNHLNNFLPLNFGRSSLPQTLEKERLFKVLSYNVRGFDRYNWSKNPHTREDIFNFINRETPDILCFQEFHTSARSGLTQREISRRLLSLPNNFIYYSIERSGNSGFGLATFSRYPIIKKSRIPFSVPGNAAMYTDILFRGDTLRIFNIHLQSIRFESHNLAFMDTVRLRYSNEQVTELKNIGSQLKKAFLLRAEQASMIANYIKDSPHTVVVAGDFNDTPQSYSYHTISKNLKDAFREAGRGIGNTYAGDLPSLRIDYILYDSPLKPYAFKRKKIKYSDHYPVSSWFYFPENTPIE